MEQNIKKIINEEVDKYTEKLILSSPSIIKKTLNELFTFSTDSFLKNIGSQETILDDDESLPEENWEWLLETINSSYNEDPEGWGQKFKDQKLKILCYKYFTKQEFSELKSIEKSLKIDVKKYFTALQNFADLQNFEDKFFNLPFETLNNFTRYILNKSKEINDNIKVSKKDIKERIQALKELRIKTVKKIAMVSKKYQTTLELNKVKELFENGLFFEDNLINRAVNEYIVKLLNYTGADERIKDYFSSAMLIDLKYHSENSVAYVNHYDSIREEDSTEYFTAKGFQIGTRFDNEIEISENKDKQEGYTIDKDSRLGEPVEKINQVTFPSDKGTEGLDGEGGIDGASGSVGGGGASGPAVQGGAGVGLPGGGGFSDAPPDLESGDMGGDEESEEGDMPKDDNGLPVDFGTPETNPEGAENGDEEK